jgi:hypothetical protein
MKPHNSTLAGRSDDHLKLGLAISQFPPRARTLVDGRLGTVSDFLFDDASWIVRWLVVDTGDWLFGRKVLLPSSVLGHLDPTERQFWVGLTMQQVKGGPDIDTDRPVSRQMEVNVYDYFGWTPYWSTGFYISGYGFMATGMASPPSG